MKMAVLLPGMTRDHRKCFQNFREVFGRYSPDVYSSVWDVDGCAMRKNYQAAAGVECVTMERADIGGIFKDYRPKVLAMEGWNDWLESHVKTVEDYVAVHEHAGEQMMTNGVLGQYYQVRKACRMIRGHYDLVVRWRFDIKAEQINFEDYVGTTSLHFCPSIHPAETAPAEIYFFGRPSMMRKACGLYDFALSAEPFNPRDYSEIHDTYTPEVLMHKMLIDCKIPFETNKTAKVVR